jgi:hypothetical protein
LVIARYPQFSSIGINLNILFAIDKIVAEKVNSKESTPRGRGFDLSPEGIRYACYFRIFWNNGVMELWSNAKNKTEKHHSLLFSFQYSILQYFNTPVLYLQA